MESQFVGEVRNFIVANFLLGRRVAFGDDDSFLEEGIIDSTGILELISHLEETYGIEVADDELNPENLDSINRIAAYLTRKLPARTSGQPPVAREVVAVSVTGDDALPVSAIQP
jgi:acyl carrier protein